MKKIFMKTRSVYVLLACMALSFAGCQKNIDTPASDLPGGDASISAENQKKIKGDFEQVNLVGDNDQYSPMRVDPNLVNAWGQAFAPTGPDWVTGQATGISAIYNTQGGDVRPLVTIPSPMNDSTGGHPTGVVFNASAGFKLPMPNANPARFIFAGTDGIISAWNGGNHAVKVIDNSATAAYTGLAIASLGNDSLVYAANFRANRVDVYNKNWHRVFILFKDFFIPQGYAPFNVQNVNNNLFVTYAKVGADGREDVGAGKGFVDIYRSNGRFLTRFATREVLNAPWGVTMAPASWANNKWDGDDDDYDNSGSDEHGGNDNSGHGNNNDNDRHHHAFHQVKQVFLIGNFGDGRINAYNQEGEFIGRLRSKGKAIVIEGLWSLSFAPATATTIDPNWLFFAAGPDEEQHGLFGYIKKN